MLEFGRWSSSQWNKERLCISMIVEEKEDVNKINLFVKLRNLQLIQRLAQKKWLRNAMLPATETQKTRLLNKIKMYFQDI